MHACTLSVHADTCVCVDRIRISTLNFFLLKHQNNYTNVWKTVSYGKKKRNIGSEYTTRCDAFVGFLT